MLYFCIDHSNQHSGKTYYIENKAKVRFWLYILLVLIILLWTVGPVAYYSGTSLSLSLSLYVVSPVKS